MNTPGYDKNNIFFKIINHEVDAKILYEDDYSIVISDIKPAAKIHLLIIPKALRISFNDFIQSEPSHSIKAVFQTVQKIATDNGLDSSGYRIIMNHGEDASQTVPHFHIHLLGGQSIGPLSANDTTH